MTHSDYSKELLNLKDENIYFYQNCLKTVSANNCTTRVFHAYLTYHPDSCPHCSQGH